MITYLYWHLLCQTNTIGSPRHPVSSLAETPLTRTKNLWEDAENIEQTGTKNTIVVYGTGEAKVVFNYEEDVAAYTVKAATDPRVANRVIIYRPPGNIASQSEPISAWEKKSGRTLKRVHVPEEELVKLSENESDVSFHLSRLILYREGINFVYVCSLTFPGQHSSGSFTQLSL
ncbi:hypothetical protein F3Y22_tig00110931pilonHSYRG00120 [Hibiscus syriacus]|uniref:NmrA-like domain-containing protein n=1 Tax=Hibiscus syriacus TaxID=106335 RepID=A0A6A2ZDT1_HIBSY|nr:hypothetical protein F3Y22_tig00110931pilonHSYRG00120 [Hibiscus syriacus]